MKALTLGLGLAISLTALTGIAGCAAPDDQAPEASDEQDIFGLGEAKYRVTARANADGLTVDIEPGQPLCFYFDASQKNQLLDLSGASEYHDDTFEPFLLAPGASAKAPWIGVGKVCAGVDGTLYAIAKKLEGESKTDASFVTSGDAKYFEVGKLRDVKAASIKPGDRIESDKVRIEGSFRVEFRKGLYEGSRAAFAIVAKGEVTPLATAPKLVVPEPSTSASDD